VAAEIIQDDDVAWPKRWDENFFDVETEGLAVDRTVETEPRAMPWHFLRWRSIMDTETQKVEIWHEISEKRSVLEMQDRVSEPDCGDEYNEFQMSVMDWEGPNSRD
jgi:hypothetical protein